MVEGSREIQLSRTLPEMGPLQGPLQPCTLKGEGRAAGPEQRLWIQKSKSPDKCHWLPTQ
jgi:hypothetical protein